jgi:two-component system alkaline phosphatase synthesis response regulator PhoP
MQNVITKNRFKILVVDDNQITLEKTISVLLKEGYLAHGTINPSETFVLIKKLQPHIVILELAMPTMDGISICNELRNDKELSNILIIIYTNRNEDYSQIAAFNAGADDYILKTVKNRIFTTRINALLKHFNKITKNDKFIFLNELIISRLGFLIIKNDNEIILPQKEFKLLMLLANNPKKVFTRKEISKKVWGNEIIPDNRTIDIHIRRLRQKIGNQFIRTVKGIGYGLNEKTM